MFPCSLSCDRCCSNLCQDCKASKMAPAALMFPCSFLTCDRCCSNLCQDCKASKMAAAALLIPCSLSCDRCCSNLCQDCKASKMAAVALLIPSSFETYDRCCSKHFQRLQGLKSVIHCGPDVPVFFLNL
jgi:hypothetical protein